MTYVGIRVRRCLSRIMAFWRRLILMYHTGNLKQLTLLEMKYFNALADMLCFSCLGNATPILVMDWARLRRKRVLW